jgi:hypothetical protein
MWGDVFACMSQDWFYDFWRPWGCNLANGQVAYLKMATDWPVLSWLVFILFGVPVAAFVVMILVNFAMRIASRI